MSAKLINEVSVKRFTTYQTNSKSKWNILHSFIKGTLKVIKKGGENIGVLPWLIGFVCAFHPANPGSTPKQHTIFAFVIYSQICACNVIKERK